MSKISVHGKEFVPYISEGEIKARVGVLGSKINSEYDGKNPLFIGVLNGCFRFAAELMHHIGINSEINFVKITSYRGTESSGNISKHIGLNSNIEGRHLIILEDIVDTGNTVEYLIQGLQAENPASIKVATLLYKPEAYHGNVKLDYVGFDIPNLFVVGYGLDYDGLGRNLNDIYQIVLPKTHPKI